jgi:endonuclease YncB( thermonuclease family)
MTSPYFLAIAGNFIIKGKEPDGDSVRFVPDDPQRLTQLKNHSRIVPSKVDGSVQLRFEGIDAPELHYGGQAQPLGVEARDKLLSWMGFTNIQYKTSPSTMVDSSTPAQVPGIILSQQAEINGRPVSYVLVEADAAGLRDGRWTNVTDAVLEKTLNFRMIDQGLAYYTVYTSTPAAHRVRLRRAALAARQAGRGVWPLDFTAEFVLKNQASVSAPGGELILPKLFRRCTDYLKDVTTTGFRGNLADWIQTVSSTGSRNENDGVVVFDVFTVHLTELLEQRNNRIAFLVDTLDVTFVEK